MPELSNNAIIDVEYYKYYDGVDLTDENYPTEELHQFINQASHLMEREAKRKFRSETITELFDGDGTGTHRTINKRITTLTSLHYWDGDSFEEITSTNYDFTFEQESGLIYFRDGNIFRKASVINNWQGFIHSYDDNPFSFTAIAFSRPWISFLQALFFFSIKA